MAFTFTNYAALPVPKSPMAHMLDNALKTYQQATNASYLKKEKEADINAKNFGPMANILSNPNLRYMSPDLQNQISQYLRQTLPNGQQGNQGNVGNQGHGNWLTNLFHHGEQQNQDQHQQGQEENQGGGQLFGNLPPSHETEEASKTLIANNRNIDTRTKDLVGAVSKLQKDKSWKGIAQQAALMAEGSGIPFMDYAKMIVPKSVRDAQNQLEDALVEAKVASRHVAHNLVQKGLTDTNSDFIKSIQNLQKSAGTKTTQAKKILQKGLDINEQENPEEEKKRIEKMGSQLVAITDPRGKVWHVAPNKVDAVLQYIEEWKRKHPNAK